MFSPFFVPTQSGSRGATGSGAKLVAKFQSLLSGPQALPSTPQQAWVDQFWVVLEGILQDSGMNSDWFATFFSSIPLRFILYDWTHSSEHCPSFLHQPPFQPSTSSQSNFTGKEIFFELSPASGLQASVG